jgi:ring-1,2-phenylacetyl-CoA epoxidase subunit PaaD
VVSGSAPESWAPEEATARAILDGVMDPEIPVLSITDLGIVRHVRCTAPGAVEIGLTPTYSGCPATDVIRTAVRSTLATTGLSVSVVEVLSPPWSSDWITARGRARLESFGIAPPAAPVSSPRAVVALERIRCPRCASERTDRLSEFASTPCKALYRCADCREPFEYFKCI